MAKGRLIFDHDKCKACELCVHYCPTKILELDANNINKKGYNVVNVIDQEKCIACGFCALMCPDSVITVFKVAS
ncbi:MAG: 4Fe-4S binding protein [Bacilli bacterium]|jgi:2-oxoglutarate ferredoxin oxidoreductase subunit delta|nr:4Fe-4S binding protein [Bacilli bacterium]